MVEILKDIASNIQEIVRWEIRLAKTEIKDEAGKTWIAARLLLAGAVVGLLGAVYLLLSAVYALTLVMPAWAAAGCVGLILALAAGSLIATGLGEWKKLHPVPQKTTDSVKEDVEWLKNQAR